MGDVTEMDGRSIFWDSKELEPVSTKIIQQYTGIKQEGQICRHSLDSSCACVLSGILGISLEKKKKKHVRQKEEEWGGRKGSDWPNADSRVF